MPLLGWILSQPGAADFGRESMPARIGLNAFRAPGWYAGEKNIDFPNRRQALARLRPEVCGTLHRLYWRKSRQLIILLRARRTYWQSVFLLTKNSTLRGRGRGAAHAADAGLEHLVRVTRQRLDGLPLLHELRHHPTRK